MLLLKLLLLLLLLLSSYYYYHHHLIVYIHRVLVHVFWPCFPEPYSPDSPWKPSCFHCSGVFKGFLEIQVLENKVKPLCGILVSKGFTQADSHLPGVDFPRTCRVPPESRLGILGPVDSRYAVRPYRSRRCRCPRKIISGLGWKAAPRIRLNKAK